MARESFIRSHTAVHRSCKSAPQQLLRPLITEGPACMGVTSQHVPDRCWGPWGHTYLVTPSAASHAAAWLVGLLLLPPLVGLLRLLLLAACPHATRQGTPASTGQTLLDHASRHLPGWCRLLSCRWKNQATGAAAQVGSCTHRGTHAASSCGVTRQGGGSYPARLLLTRRQLHTSSPGRCIPWGHAERCGCLAQQASRPFAAPWFAAAAATGLGTRAWPRQNQGIPSPGPLLRSPAQQQAVSGNGRDRWWAQLNLL